VGLTMVVFTKIAQKHTMTGHHIDVYKIDFDEKKLAEFVKEAFIGSEYYPFPIPYGDLKIDIVKGEPVLVHEYDTSG